MLEILNVHIILKEFGQGKLFSEDYECNLDYVGGQIKSSECKEVSTYTVGSKSRSGPQVIVNQRLTLKSLENGFKSTNTGI